jgi:hypothetical protein
LTYFGIPLKGQFTQSAVAYRLAVALREGRLAKADPGPPGKKTKKQR